MVGIILIGMPASGKGTQSEFLQEKYNFVHISTGDLLREESLKDSLEGMYISEKLECGELVDDNLITEILEKKLSLIDSKGFILDGFPRDINQAIKLDEILKKMNISRFIVINIVLDKEVSKNRIVGRMTCPSCKKVYNNLVDYLKPTIINTCDDCHVLLEKRSDDNEEAFEERFKLYLEETKPLIDYYDNKNIVYKVDGNKDANAIFKDIQKIVEGEI